MQQVESAFEYARICRKLDFHNFVFSMKASNPVIMVQAYRLLVAEMNILGWDYPLHLGVTEAGEGEDGRMKSAIGIGTLLMVRPLIFDLLIGIKIRTCKPAYLASKHGCSFLKIDVKYSGWFG